MSTQADEKTLAQLKAGAKDRARLAPRMRPIQRELQAPNTTAAARGRKNGGQKFAVRQIAPEGDRPEKPAFPRKKKTKTAIPGPLRTAEAGTATTQGACHPRPTRLPTARALASPHPERAHALSKSSGTRQQSRTHKARQHRLGQGAHPCLFKKNPCERPKKRVEPKFHPYALQ
ncbi:MAG: hypothetical protein ACTTJV_01930 [Ottowia sp.]